MRPQFYLLALLPTLFNLGVASPIQSSESIENVLIDRATSVTSNNASNSFGFGYSLPGGAVRPASGPAFNYSGMTNLTDIVKHLNASTGPGLDALSQSSAQFDGFLEWAMFNPNQNLALCVHNDRDPNMCTMTLIEGHNPWADWGGYALVMLYDNNCNKLGGAGAPMWKLQSANPWPGGWEMNVPELEYGVTIVMGTYDGYGGTNLGIWYRDRWVTPGDGTQYGGYMGMWRSPFYTWMMYPFNCS